MATRKRNSSKTASSSVQEFKKSNEAIGLRVVHGALTLLSRKIFNVMIYNAQKAREPGVDAPIKTPTSNKYFWMRLSELAKDASYDSKDTDHLKEVLENMQDIKLLMESEIQWTSERLVSSVTMVYPDNQENKSGVIWLGYAFPPEVHEKIMSPSTYTRLSIVYQSSLKSGSALALYEICRRYATNPSKLTGVHPVEYWFNALNGSPVDPEKVIVYKYFKRDVIKPAIAEINAITDIAVELIEHKSGRRVDKLQFFVELKKQSTLDFPSRPVIDTALLERVACLGFSNTDAADIVAQYPDYLILEALSRVEIRMQAKNMSQLQAPAGYFRWVIQELERNPNQEYLESNLEVIPNVYGSTELVSTVERTSYEAPKITRAQKAMGFYEELSEAERDRFFNEFKESQPASPVINFEKGLEGRMVRSLFSQWFARKLWGDPNEDNSQFDLATQSERSFLA